MRTGAIGMGRWKAQIHAKESAWHVERKLNGVQMYMWRCRSRFVWRPAAGCREISPSGDVERCLYS